MYQNLLVGMKQRLMSEAEQAYQKHPAFADKVKVHNKFPYLERIQYGLVLRNTSANQLRLSADNFISDLFSHVRLARQGNHPGLAIEWVRENESSVTKKVTEDVSSQLGDNQRLFYTDECIVAGPGETHYSDSPGQIHVSVNGVDQTAESVDGLNKAVLLYSTPGAGSTVEISYYARNIVNPCIFLIEFTEDTEFFVYPLYVIENELVIERTTGVEITASLDYTNLQEGSEAIYQAHQDGKKITLFIKDTDYTIDYVSGIITFLVPLEKNYRIYADYRYIDPDYINGPHTFKIYQDIHDIIPGVILSIGRRAKKDDKMVVIVSQFREQQAKIYGGHWEMSLDMAVVSKDPEQMAEMTDQLVNYLWGERKSVLEFEGITLLSVEPSGESEEVHIETTQDLYYESSVSIRVQTEWQSFVPYLPLLKIRNIYVYPDGRPVFKTLIAGYEKLT